PHPGRRAPPPETSRCAIASSYRAGDELLGRREHRLARVGGLQHDRVARLLEHLAHEEVEPLEAVLDDDLSRLELGHDRALLALPPRLRPRDLDPRHAR